MAAGCALPPERSERKHALRAAIEPCLKPYPSVKLTDIDDYGQVYARAPTACSARASCTTSAHRRSEKFAADSRAGKI